MGPGGHGPPVFLDTASANDLVANVGETEMWEVADWESFAIGGDKLVEVARAVEALGVPSLRHNAIMWHKDGGFSVYDTSVKIQTALDELRSTLEGAKAFADGCNGMHGRRGGEEGV